MILRSSLIVIIDWDNFIICTTSPLNLLLVLPIPPHFNHIPVVEWIRLYYSKFCDCKCKWKCRTGARTTRLPISFHQKRSLCPIDRPTERTVFLLTTCSAPLMLITWISYVGIYNPDRFIAITLHSTTGCNFKEHQHQPQQQQHLKYTFFGITTYIVSFPGIKQGLLTTTTRPCHGDNENANWRWDACSYISPQPLSPSCVASSQAGLLSYRHSGTLRYKPVNSDSQKLKKFPF